jgi:hypothetical protein
MELCQRVAQLLSLLSKYGGNKSIRVTLCQIEGGTFCTNISSKNVFEEKEVEEKNVSIFTNLRK